MSEGQVSSLSSVPVFCQPATDLPYLQWLGLLVVKNYVDCTGTPAQLPQYFRKAHMRSRKESWRDGIVVCSAWNIMEPGEKEFT